MIRLLVKLGTWLDKRFPEKVVVARADYEALSAQIQSLEQRIKSSETMLDVAVSRLSTVETNAVHKTAVQDVIKIVTVLKDDMVSLKANLGLNRMVTDREMQIMLSGEPTSNE